MWREVALLVHCQREHKLVETLLKTVWGCLFFSLKLPYDPVITLLGMLLNKIKYQLENISVLLYSLQCILQQPRQKVKVKSLSHVQLFANPRTIYSIEFSRPEYWSGQPFPSPGDLPKPGIKCRSLALQVDSLPAETQGKPQIERGFYKKLC